MPISVLDIEDRGRPTYRRAMAAGLSASWLHDASHRGDRRMDWTARKLPPDDRLELHELLGRYNAAEDAGQVEQWANTFTADGVHIGVNGEQLTGKDALARFMAERSSRTGMPQSYHLISNVLTAPAVDGARADDVAMLIDKTEHGYRIRRMSRKTHGMREEEGEWRISYIRATPLPAKDPA
jgi:uncharacterized protein (TIGR02246 family)